MVDWGDSLVDHCVKWSLESGTVLPWMLDACLGRVVIWWTTLFRAFNLKQACDDPAEKWVAAKFLLALPIWECCGQWSRRQEALLHTVGRVWGATLGRPLDMQAMLDMWCVV